MSAECLPMTLLPHQTRLYLDYLSAGETAQRGPLAGWYAAAPLGAGWMTVGAPALGRTALADLLRQQSIESGAGAETLANIAKLAAGARTVVTGQQTALFGGPLLTWLKAATAIARAAEATAATGIDHVPVFWLASEDHDMAEADQVTLPAKMTLETLRLGLAHDGSAVGGRVLGTAVLAALERVRELLGHAPVCDLLEACYTPEMSLAGGFARLMTRLFAAHGLIVMDAASRDFHALGRATLRAAIERAEELEAALLARTAELERAGYHAQVLVKAGASLLFLIDSQTGQRQALRRTAAGAWKAGGETYTQAELLAILDAEPERISPNALLRPLFQDTILPTAAYIGGPAEIAYFAQSQVLYERVLGRLTPVLPRLSATLVEPAVATVMDRHELTVEALYAAGTADALALRLGARAMPIEGKRKLAAAGTALYGELTALTGYMAAMDEGLGRSAAISASKMQYQMNRLRGMAARFEVEKQASLSRHAAAVMLKLMPEGHAQERVIGGVWFLAQAGEGLIDRLVEQAQTMCLGHCVVRL